MSREYPCVYYDNEKCKKFSEDGITSYCVLGPCSYETPSNADRIRAMTDEELAERLKNLYTEEMEHGGGDIARLWCDGKAGCIDADGAIDCDDEKLTACILRWLQQPCESVHERATSCDVM